MDVQTAHCYQKNAKEIFDRYDACCDGVSRYFTLSFPPQSKILDIGTGSGRDARQLLKLGYDAYGVDPCNELVSLALTKYPELSGRITEGSLPRLENPFDGNFDGVLCSAVLMHISNEQLLDSVFAIRSVLKDNGRLLLSIPISRPGLDNECRDKHGRLFIIRVPDYLQLLFERIGFQLIGRWDDEDSFGRENHFWSVLLFQLKNSQILRPIDQIEGILNRDKKTATYKLALFRSLCDVALTNYQRAEWKSDRTVGIPIDDIVEKWIYYYWPIFESSKFIPQIRGESKNSRKQIRFRHSLNKLISYYKNSGSLSRFTIDYRSSKLNEEAELTLYEVFKNIRGAIVEGPVNYAGGSLETGTVFEYDPRDRMIMLSAELWREFVLMAPWVSDALILRWAELTSKISKNSIKPSEMIDLLLTVPIPERDVADARRIYLQLDTKECVWSGKSLKKNFDVDHVIPFSLWGNNDLWNLLPTTPSVNRDKRDKLPTRSLLIERKDYIVDYWRVLRNATPARFDYETSKFIGTVRLTSSDWESQMFSSVVEAIETTALHRGCERWEL